MGKYVCVDFGIDLFVIDFEGNCLWNFHYLYINASSWALQKFVIFGLLFYFIKNQRLIFGLLFYFRKMYALWIFSASVLGLLFC